MQRSVEEGVKNEKLGWDDQAVVGDISITVETRQK